MTRNLADLYTDYLLSSFGQTLATGLSSLWDWSCESQSSYAHVIEKNLTSKDWWLFVKPYARKVQTEDGVLIVNDSFTEKPCTDYICCITTIQKGVWPKALTV